MSIEDCAFCELREDNARIINYSDELVSFLPNPRMAKGHSLVIPRRHVEDPRLLTDEEVVAIDGELDRLSSLLLSTLATGLDRWQKYRPDVPEGTGVKVNHVHFHLIPSNPGEEIYEEALSWGGVGHQPLPEDEREVVLSILRPHSR